MSNELDEIERALDREDLPAAAELAQHALAQGVDQALVFNLVAWRREQDGRFEEAEAVLRDGLRRWPDDPSLHLALGTALRGAGKLSGAVRAFEDAIERDPGYAAAWYERGQTFEKGGALADAADDFRRALELEPGNPAVHASLAASEARRGQRTAAVQHAEAALAIDPANVIARNALTLVALEEKRFTDAIALLEPVAGRDDDHREMLVSTRTLLGDAYEGAGRYDEAFTSYAKAQALFRTIHAARLDGEAGDALSFVERIGSALATADPSHWYDGSPLPEQPAATHVFLTGYPRSGTTLAENILASLPNATAIEERPTLAAVDRGFLQEADGLRRFAELPATEIGKLRRAYWDKAREAAGEDLSGKLFVDMDPFKGARLPVIARLFPGAKVVVMRRDPRDVVWSCFHTSFAFNAGTLAFATLQSTARHYSLTQKIIQQSLDTLPIDAFELRYEHLVRDFDATTRALCTFLEVPWDEALRQFDRTAERRGVSTASTTQVRRGLYDGSGGWKRYAGYLAEVEPILAPWIEKLGYV